MTVVFIFIKFICNGLFVKMADTYNCLNYLLPAKRDSEIIAFGQ